MGDLSTSLDESLGLWFAFCRVRGISACGESEGSAMAALEQARDAYDDEREKFRTRANEE